MPSIKIFLLAVPRRYIFCGSFKLFMSRVCHAFSSVSCCLVVTCWERGYILALFCDVLCFVTFPCGILCQVRYLILFYPFLIYAAFLTFILKLKSAVWCSIIYKLYLICRPISLGLYVQLFKMHLAKQYYHLQAIVKCTVQTVPIYR